jgi:hypothetical protein
MSTKVNYIYIGPGAPVLGLRQWKLYLEDTPPASMRDYLVKNPLLRCLYIPTEQLPAARKNLKTNPQSAEFLAFKLFASIVSKLPR